MKRDQVEEYIKISIDIKKRRDKFNDALEGICDWFPSMDFHYDYENFICKLIEKQWDNNCVNLIDEFTCDWYYDKYSRVEAKDKWLVEISKDREYITWTNFKKTKELDSYKRIVDIKEFLDYIELFD